jgi:cell division protein FtsL
MLKRILLITVLTITCMLSGSSGLVMAADNSSNDIATEEAIGLYEKMLNADNAEKYYKQLSLAEQKAVNSIATNLKYETVTTTGY